MKLSLLRIASLVVLLGASALGGCATQSDASSGDESAESDLTRSQRIVVAPLATDVARDYMVLAKASFDRAKASHPSVQTLKPDTLDTFTGDERSLDTALGTMLSERPSHEVSVADAMSALETYATAKIVEAAGADKRLGEAVSEMPRGLSSFFSQARDKLIRDTLKTTLKSSQGIAVDRLLDEWTRISSDVDTGFAPYQLNGRAKLASVQRLLGLQMVNRTESGVAAVDAFKRALEDAEGQNLDELVTMWKSSSVKEQFFYEYGEDGIGGIVLAVVDEHGQMFAFTILVEA